MLLMAGYFERRWDWPGYEKWEANKYRLKRLGATVHATIRARSSRVDGEGLFTVPPGFRPAVPVAWDVGVSDGVPHALQINSEGIGSYVSLSTPAADIPITYHTTHSWHTQDPAQMEFQGEFLHRPTPGAGKFQLWRQGLTVLAQLSALATPVPIWEQPPKPRPQLSVDPETWLSHAQLWEPSLNVWIRESNKVVNVGALVKDPSIRYDILGREYDPPAWQIQFRDNIVGWIDDTYVQTYGDVSGVPETWPLFWLPDGFRPGRTRHWILQSQRVDAQGQILDRQNWVDLGIQISPWGMAYYDHVPVREAGYRHFTTTLAWPVGADVCQRSQAVKEGLLKALNLESCQQVTWMDLASLRELEVNTRTNIRSNREYLTSDLESFLPFDLMGLTRLRRLVVTHDSPSVISLETPPLSLAHVPQLERLVFQDITLTQLSEDFLVNTPDLRYLDLRLAQVTRLPSGFLTFTPQLQSLYLDLGPELTDLPPGFLAHTPHLRHLHLRLRSEALAQLPPDFLRDAPRLETLTLHVWGDGRVPLLPGFLSHAPRLQRAVIATERAQHATQQPLLVLEEPASFLTQAPQLQELWLHRVAAGSDFLDHLPDTARIHWVSWGSAPMPPALSLAATAPQSWLFVRTTDFIPESWASVAESLNLVLSHTQSEIPQATITWLSEQRLRALILDLESHLDINPEDYHRLLEAFRAAQGRQTPRRVSLLLPRDDPQVLPRGLLSGYAYEWLYLKNLDMRTLPPTFFADVTATALLLEPGLHNTWHFSDLELPLRHLLQASQVQHLGLILPSQLWLPAEALGNLDFVCLELDLTPLLHNSTFEDLQTFLEVENISLTWTARAVKADPTALRSWWQRTERRPQLAQPTWFESSHMPWAQERGCRHSLYLRMHGDVIVFAPHMLALMGQLRHVRLTYNLADCPQCPHTPAGGR